VSPSRAGGLPPAVSPFAGLPSRRGGDADRAEADALERLRLQLLSAAAAGGGGGGGGGAGDASAEAAIGVLSAELGVSQVVGASTRARGVVQWTVDGSELLFPVNRAVLGVGMACAADGAAARAQGRPLMAVGAQRRFVGHHSDDVVGLALSPDGRLLASVQAGASPRLVVWEIASGRALAVVPATVTGHVGGTVPGSVAFSPDGRSLAAAGIDDKRRLLIVVLDVSPLSAAAAAAAAGAPLDPATVGGSLTVTARQVSDFAISRLRWSPYEPDRLVSAGRENARLWSVRRAHLPGLSVALNEYARGVEFTDVAFDPRPAVRAGPPVPAAVAGDGGADVVVHGRLFFASPARPLLQRDYATRALLAIVRLHAGRINALGVTPTLCITASDDGFTRVWPLDFSDYFLETAHEGRVTSVALTADARAMAVGTGDELAVRYGAAPVPPGGNSSFDVSSNIDAGLRAVGTATAAAAAGPFMPTAIAAAAGAGSGINDAHARAPRMGATSASDTTAAAAAASTRDAPAADAAALSLAAARRVRSCATVGVLHVGSQEYTTVMRGHGGRVTAVCHRPLPPRVMPRAPRDLLPAAAATRSRSGSEPEWQDPVAADVARAGAMFQASSSRIWRALEEAVGQEAATASFDGTVRVWRKVPHGGGDDGGDGGGYDASSGSTSDAPESWRQAFEFLVPGEPCACLAYAPAYAKGGTARCWMPLVRLTAPPAGWTPAAAPPPPRPRRRRSACRLRTLALRSGRRAGRRP